MQKVLLVIGLSLLFVCFGMMVVHSSFGGTVFINEIHYDNTGTDQGESIEIAGPAGTDLLGWSIVLYNGSNGAAYSTRDLTATILSCLGIDHEKLSIKPQGLDVRLTSVEPARVVREILG